MAHYSYYNPEGSYHGQAMQHLPFRTSDSSLRLHLLHGNLDIWVKEAKNLPNMDLLNHSMGNLFGSLSGKIQTSDPYVTVSVSNAVLARTFVIKDNENPVWAQHFHVPVAHRASEVQFVVKDNDLVGSEIIGAVGVPADQLVSGYRVNATYPLVGPNGRPCSSGAFLSFSIQYIPIEWAPLYRGGAGAVPGTYFPMRGCGGVTLYQDAHVRDGALPTVVLGDGRVYERGLCWREVYEAVRGARRMVYIAGWSVYHLVRLVRDDPLVEDGGNLGELLKVKSQEGVRVLLLVWDDPTSTSILGYKTEGVMNTGDDETRRYFKHSSVRVLLCPRIAGKGSWAKKQETGTIYTHHQKSVIVDVESSNYGRKIVAFVGGLDLCKGRYDTPQHPLFSTLQTIHKDDYHNPNFTGPTAGCPREPWHDLHCRIDGPAAYDVLKNFEERWLRAAKRHGPNKLKSLYDDCLLKLERMPEIMGINEAATVSEDDPESWNVQVFRSIDSNSVKGFPKNPREASERNLVCGKNVLIDMSVHTAYVKAIRSAQHFIYIENQYFLGSSYNWAHYKDLGANNLIPMEIALKIANKIRAGERFAAYILVPMWPEGVPTSTPTQRILFWQYNTMQMMYEIIYNALVETGLHTECEPQDYLNFFCLGNREPDYSGSDMSNVKSSSTSTPQALSRKNRRFMIYVHSKGMIVDDEYVILGSANINQRSLAGTRDTEIAMGAYQPHYTWASKNANPRGEIYGYRMSLWAEHTGTLEQCFEHPESLECVRRVRWMGELNWREFESSEISAMRGHLLKYPLHVDSSGKVTPLPGCETFPDMGGKIIGTFTGIQENLTI
ncbi:Phospholipase D beta 1 [Striga hermonthica]|uniref:Phospholipase D n=1 Tax=Striga hermonthica TaxID=68872 RepID=A0A9N7P2J5_STRHE|nr:Phospholipase D beta 1 [Striga hermonthica]